MLCTSISTSVSDDTGVCFFLSSFFFFHHYCVAITLFSFSFSYSIFFSFLILSHTKHFRISLMCTHIICNMKLTLSFPRSLVWRLSNNVEVFNFILLFFFFFSFFFLFSFFFSFCFVFPLILPLFLFLFTFSFPLRTGSTCNAPYVFVYTTITNTAPTRTQTFKQYQSPINYQLWSDDDDSALQLFQMADFNGDGLSDLMYLDTDAVR